MLDTNKLIDTLKIKLYNNYLIQNHVYPEGESGYHKQITNQVVETFIDPMNLSKTARILDLGCGPGYFLDQMKEREFTNVIGVTLSQGDIDLCESKGHTIKQYDLSFLPQNDGFTDESVDLIFLRHALEHSPYPIFSLLEYNRLLNRGGKIYIEVPAPDCDRKHEFNLNHYSILGQTQLIALLQRTGFVVENLQTIEFDLQLPDKENNLTTVKEKFIIIVASKQMAIDIR